MGIRGSNRRGFLRRATTALGAAQVAGAQSRSPGMGTLAGGLGEYPRVYSGRQLQMIAFPLGGVGAGSISLGGRGQLRDWEIFNRPNKGLAPSYGLPSIWARSGNGKP